MATSVEPNYYGGPEALSDFFSGWSSQRGSRRNQDLDLANVAKAEAETAAKNQDTRFRDEGRSFYHDQMAKPGQEEIITQVPDTRFRPSSPDMIEEHSMQDVPLTADQQANNNRLYAQGADVGFGNGKINPWSMTSAGQMVDSVGGTVSGRSMEQLAKQNAAAAEGIQNKAAAEGMTKVDVMVDGQPTVGFFNPGTGEMVVAGQAVPKSQISMGTDADGNQYVTIGSGTGGATNGTRGKLQMNEADVGSVLQQLDDMEQYVTQDLFNRPLQAVDWIKGQAERFGYKMDDFGTDYSDRSTALFTRVGMAFNQYRKQITGAAAAIKELKVLQKDFVSNKLNYTKFKSKLKNLREIYARDLQYWRSMQGKPAGEMNRGEDGRVEAPPGFNPGQTGATIGAAADAAAGVPGDDGPEIMYIESNDPGKPPLMSLDGGSTWIAQ